MAKRDYKLFHNLIIVIIFLGLLLIFGAIGYKQIPGWSWLDALYMTFISLSTVGFREVSNLGDYGRIFTMVIILFGMMIIAMLSASVTSWFVRNELIAKRKTRKMKRAIQNLKDHTILCGAGDTGTTVINEFIHARRPIVVIEEKQEILDKLEEQYPDLLIIPGDATKDEVLEDANIEKAGGLITALSIDSDNLFVVVSAKALNPNMIIISRSVDPHTENKLYRAGANYVISPNMTEGLRMAAVMLRPTVVSFLEVMMRGGDLSFRLEEVNVPKGASLHKKSLQNAKIPQETGLIVIAVKKALDSKWIFNPSSSTVLHENDKLIVLGDPDKMDKLHTFLRE